MKFRSMPIAASLVLLSAALFAAAPPLQAQTVTEKADKLVALMKADNLSYGATTSPTVFTIHFTGTNLKDIKVVLAVGGDEDSDLVVFVTVTPKATMPRDGRFPLHPAQGRSRIRPGEGGLRRR